MILLDAEIGLIVHISYETTKSKAVKTKDVRTIPISMRVNCGVNAFVKDFNLNDIFTSRDYVHLPSAEKPDTNDNHSTAVLAMPAAVRRLLVKGALKRSKVWEMFSLPRRWIARTQEMNCSER